MSSFQGTNNRVYGVGEQKKILGLLLNEKKIYFKKTPNQEKLIESVREIDKEYEI